jgi:hypothetical protein
MTGIATTDRESPTSLSASEYAVCIGELPALEIEDLAILLEDERREARAETSSDSTDWTAEGGAGMRTIKSHIFGDVPVGRSSLDELKVWAARAEIYLADRGAPDEMSLRLFGQRAPVVTLRSRTQIARALVEADRVIAELRLSL